LVVMHAPKLQHTAKVRTHAAQIRFMVNDT
jgi:hypothetical protein